MSNKDASTHSVVEFRDHPNAQGAVPFQLRRLFIDGHEITCFDPGSVHISTDLGGSPIVSLRLTPDRISFVTEEGSTRE